MDRIPMPTQEQQEAEVRLKMMHASLIACIAQGFAANPSLDLSKEDQANDYLVLASSMATGAMCSVGLAAPLPSNGQVT